MDESALTGGSLPVEARRSDVIYSGSVVRRGEARCVVVGTGADTFFGRTAELVKIAKPKSHQEEVMMAIAKEIGIEAGIGGNIISDAEPHIQQSVQGAGSKGTAAFLVVASRQGAAHP
ncbi:MAG: hypothetical protein M0033_13210 [Nitrospiraceae bacterium]|nr:hypothetical protein [Nitrospiraceae bacterium]